MIEPQESIWKALPGFYRVVAKEMATQELRIVTENRDLRFIEHAIRILRNRIQGMVYTPCNEQGPMPE